MDYGADPKIIVDGKLTEKADLWKEPEAVQETVEEVADKAKDHTSLLQIGVLTKDGVDQLRKKLGISEQQMTAEERTLRSAKTVAVLRAKKGLENGWFREQFGYDFNLEQFEAERGRSS